MEVQESDGRLMPAGHHALLVCFALSSGVVYLFDLRGKVKPFKITTLLIMADGTYFFGKKNQTRC